jgi:DNA-directed RNA polymerase specialized sigma24 family protein
MENLTARVLEYQRSRDGLDGLVADLAPRVLSYPRRRFGWDEDACSEFYAWFHPRLLRVLGRFRDQGRPFESYLVSVLHWQARSFARRFRREEQAWTMGPRLVAAGAADDAAEDAAEDAAPARPAPLPPLAPFGDADRRALLFLVLKCCRSFDPSWLAAVTSATGVAPRRLAGLVELLQAGREPSERRLEALRLRRNGAFSRARTLEHALARATDPAEVEALRRRLEAARRCLAAAVERMARVRRDPTNREVARALGVPKGTVDCSLFLLKRRLAAVYDPDRERTA